MIAFAPSLDTVGWFTATVADVAVAAASAVPGWRARARPGGRPVLGVPSEDFLAQAEAPARAAFDRQVDTLRAAGFTVRTSRLFADAASLAETLFIVSRFEFAQEHRDRFAAFGERYQAKTAEAVRAGRGIGADVYAAARRAQDEARTAYADRMAEDGIDVWITPGATGPAPRGLASTGDPAMSSPFSLVGAPAVNLPAGTDRSRLPLGLQCAAGPGADEELLAHAALIHAALAATVG
jgi:Asp-tRNA(Asn)/Glu-tRNA(Gln) amidotransferase A subunit family amidase